MTISLTAREGMPPICVEHRAQRLDYRTLAIVEGLCCVWIIRHAVRGEQSANFVKCRTRATHAGKKRSHGTRFVLIAEIKKAAVLQRLRGGGRCRARTYDPLIKSLVLST